MPRRQLFGMSTVPATTHEYLNFLQGEHGPQAAFARRFDSTVRLMKQQSVPAAYDIVDIAQIWTTLEKLEVQVTDQRVSADDSVFGSTAAQKTAWWKDHGLAMVERFVRAHKLHTDPEKISAKELAGKVLDTRSCVEIVQSGTWRQFKIAVRAEELEQAVALLDADTDASAKVARAIMFLKDSHNLVIAGADTERKEVYRTLLLFEDHADSAIEDELVSSLVELEYCEPDFAGSVRQSLQQLHDQGAALEAGIATVLGVQVGQLHKVQIGTLKEAMVAVIRVWRIVLGGIVGKDMEKNLQHMMQLWANQDEQFARWPRFREGDAASPLSLVRAIFAPRAKEWGAQFAAWTRRRSGAAKPVKSLGEYIAPKTLALEDTDYRAMKDALADMRRRPAQWSRAAGGGAAVEVAGGDDAAAAAQWAAERSSGCWTRFSRPEGRSARGRSSKRRRSSRMDTRVHGAKCVRRPGRRSGSASTRRKTAGGARQECASTAVARTTQPETARSERRSGNQNTLDATCPEGRYTCHFCKGLDDLWGCLWPL
eukprot:SAG11_NODE_5134_length_1655_cov_1.939589_1_plen_539_part_10